MFTVIMNQETGRPVTMRVNGLGHQVQIHRHELMKASEVPSAPWMDSRGWSRWHWTVIELDAESSALARGKKSCRPLWGRTLDRVRRVKNGKHTAADIEQLWTALTIDHNEAKTDPLGELRRQRAAACQIAQAFSQRRSQQLIVAIMIEKVGAFERAVVRQAHVYENGKKRSL